MLRSGSGQACFAEGQVQPGAEQGVSRACISRGVPEAGCCTEFLPGNAEWWAMQILNIMKCSEGPVLAERHV